LEAQYISGPWAFPNRLYLPREKRKTLSIPPENSSKFNMKSYGHNSSKFNMKYKGTSQLENIIIVF
jgi:hypothetical protein